MLKGDFFTLNKIQIQENQSYKIALSLNPAHPIFQGHFPGNPIVPGVCLTQMVKEILEEILVKSFVMRKADNIKFTAIVNPMIHPNLEATLILKSLDIEQVQADLSFYFGDIVFYKFKGSFAPHF